MSDQEDETARPKSDETKNVISENSPESCGSNGGSMTFMMEDDTLMDPSDSEQTDWRASNNRSLLIAEKVEDELKGCLEFIENYGLTFGQSVPRFFAGTLEDAANEALLQSALKKRLLGLYLHHVNSVATNLFCSQVLGSDTILNVLNDAFLIWGWDSSDPDNARLFQRSAERCFGASICSITQNISQDRYPAFIVLTRIRTNITVRAVFYGNVIVEDVLVTLKEIADEFKRHKDEEIREEEIRSARERLISVQDEAYRLSLEIDKEKVFAKRRKLLDELEEKDRRKRKKEEQRRLMEEERLLVETRLPEEPAYSAENVFTFRFRLPNGKTLQRKFSPSDSLEALFNYLLVQGYRLEEFRVISSWPRRELSELDREQTVRDLGLRPQETIILVKR